MSLLGLDLETTGLDVDSDEIIEIGMIKYDDDLNEGAYFQQLIVPSPAAFTRMMQNDFVREMHTKSGLLDELHALAPQELGALSTYQHALRWMSENFGDEKPIPLGSSLAFDRKFIERSMPQLNNLWHYRSIDVSSLKELAARWNKPVYDSRPGVGENAHRVLDDIRASVAELRHYRQNFLVTT